MGDDYREGLTAVLSVQMTNVQFEGQTKTKLGNPAVYILDKIDDTALVTILEALIAVAYRYALVDYLDAYALVQKREFFEPSRYGRQRLASYFMGDRRQLDRRDRQRFRQRHNRYHSSVSPVRAAKKAAPFSGNFYLLHYNISSKFSQLIFTDFLDCRYSDPTA